MIQAAMRPRYGVVERKTSALFKLYIHITPRHFSWSFFTELEPDLIMHDMDICEPEGKAFIRYILILAFNIAESLRCRQFVQRATHNLRPRRRCRS